MGPETGGSLNPNDLATLSLLNGGGRYGGVGVGGGGYGGYGGGGHGSFASPSANAIRIDSVGQKVEDQNDCTRTLLAGGMERISDNFENATRSREFAGVNKAIVDSEFRTNDRARDIELNNLRQSSDTSAAIAACCCETQKSIAQAAKEAAKCCCDAQLTAAKDHAALQALIIKENSATRELMRGDALAAANAKIIQLETINALADKGHR